MQVGHELGQIPVRPDQRFVHVARVAGGVAQPLQPLDVRQKGKQIGEAGGQPRCVGPVVGVDVLAEQGDFLDPRVDKAPGLGEHLMHRPAGLGPARIGDDAERAELVAPLLHGEKGREPAPDGNLALRGGQVRELVLLGKVRIDHSTATAGPPDQFGQAMIGLRSDHQIDHRRAPGDFVALGLRYAPGNRDHHVGAGGAPFRLPLLEAPQFGKNLLGGLFTDVAGVEDHQIGLGDLVCAPIAVRGQRVRHALAVIDVHLTAVGLDEELLGHRRALAENARRWNARALCMPETGAGEGRVEGMRELVLTGLPYSVACSIVGEEIVIVRILHGARRWPADL